MHRLFPSLWQVPSINILLGQTQSEGVGTNHEAQSKDVED